MLGVVINGKIYYAAHSTTPNAFEYKGGWYITEKDAIRMFWEE